MVATTPRKQDKAFPDASVHQKYQRKQQAIKKTFCNIPSMIMHVVLDENQYEFYNLIWTRFMFYLSTTVDPIICMTFIQSYHRGFKEVQMCWNRFFCTMYGKKRENGETDEINLQDIRIIPGRR